MSRAIAISIREFIRDANGVVLEKRHQSIELCGRHSGELKAHFIPDCAELVPIEPVAGLKNAGRDMRD